MTNLVTVPLGGDADAVLAARGHAALDKMKAGRKQWIEGTLELAAFLRDLRLKYPDHREFSQWLARYGFQEFDARDRSALIKLAADPGARILLEQSTGRSVHHIWYERPNKPSRTLVRSDKGALSHRSGSSQRKRAARIPDVMQDRPPPKRLQDLTLTPEQVDPNFTGTPLEFTRKYGHVTLHTKDQIEDHKQQQALSEWMSAVTEHARTARVLLALPIPEALAEWKTRSGKAEKLRAWCDGIQRACDAIRAVTKE
jgi:hypothetical protein